METIRFSRCWKRKSPTGSVPVGLLVALVVVSDHSICLEFSFVAAHSVFLGFSDSAIHSLFSGFSESAITRFPRASPKAPDLKWLPTTQ